VAGEADDGDLFGVFAVGEGPHMTILLALLAVAATALAVLERMRNRALQDALDRMHASYQAERLRQAQ
jgi:hypothetical protein